MENDEFTPEAPGGATPTDPRPLGYWLRAVDALIAREFATAFADDEGRMAPDRFAAAVAGIRDRVAGAVSADDLATTTASLEAIARELGWDESMRMPHHPRGFGLGFGPGLRPGFGAGFGRGFRPGFAPGFGPGEHPASEHGEHLHGHGGCGRHGHGGHGKGCGRGHGHHHGHGHGHGKGRRAFERGFTAGFEAAQRPTDAAPAASGTAV